MSHSVLVFGRRSNGKCAQLDIPKICYPSPLMNTIWKKRRAATRKLTLLFPLCLSETTGEEFSCTLFSFLIMTPLNYCSWPCIVICKKPSVRDECSNTMNTHCLPPRLFTLCPKTGWGQMMRTGIGKYWEKKINYTSEEAEKVRKNLCKTGNK